MTIAIHSGPGNDSATLHGYMSCPFRKYDDSYLGFSCNHPKATPDMGCSRDHEKIPKGCPLIKNPFYIKLSPSLQEEGDALNVRVDSGDPPSV